MRAVDIRKNERPQRTFAAAFTFWLTVSRYFSSTVTAVVAGFDVRCAAAADTGVIDGTGTRRKPLIRDNQYWLKGEYITPPCRAEW